MARKQLNKLWIIIQKYKIEATFGCYRGTFGLTRPAFSSIEPIGTVTRNHL